uniref:Uma2 family endonuclease n=1 Tax=uncultured Lamprocystis sp. TaxID=543132 RepID=UPI0025F7056D
DSDPAVEWAGVDAGFTPAPGTLRAPDVAVAAPAGADADGWIPGAPPLAIEYAGRGQDQADLKVKIAELLAAGTRYVWVVRVHGPRRVEVHEAGQPPRLVGAGEVLEAPGILRNPIPVEALYDRAAGHRATLRNLLQREGYDSLEAVRTEGRKEGRKDGRQEGHAEGLAEAILALLQGRGIPVDTTLEIRVRACRERDTLHRWLLRAARVERGEQLFDAP